MTFPCPSIATQYCFNLFDRLIMLVRGRVVYFGPTSGAAAFATDACPRVKEMTEGYNDAEFLVVRPCLVALFEKRCPSYCPNSVLLKRSRPHFC